MQTYSLAQSTANNDTGCGVPGIERFELLPEAGTGRNEVTKLAGCNLLFCAKSSCHMGLIREVTSAGNFGKAMSSVAEQSGGGAKLHLPRVLPNTTAKKTAEHAREINRMHFRVCCKLL